MALTLTLSSVLAVANAAVIPKGVELHAAQTFVRNNGSEPETLDPALAESVGANNISRDLFEGLTATNASDKVVPGVAESWTQPDLNTWVFKLRKNAKWSNGDPVTAEDFVYGIRRYVDPKTASPYATTFGIFLLNGKEVIAGKKPVTDLGVKAIDKYTLELRTPYPISFMLSMVSNTNMGPVHKATVDKYGKEWTKPGKIVGNGAFVLKDWQVNSKVILEKSPNYWDAANVQLTRVTYLPVESDVADVKLFESGENDWVYQLPPGTYEKYKAQYPKDIRNSPLLALRYYALQNQDALLKDVRVRKALSMVVDRDILAQRVTADGQLPAYGITLRGLEGANMVEYEWATWPMAKRVDEAKKLLAAAGVKPATKLVFSYNTSEYHKKMAIFVASEWKTKLGLDMEIEAMEFKVLLRKRKDGQFQVSRHGWNADYNDVTTFLSQVQCDSDNNNNFNCNRKAEDLISQGNNAKDPAQRRKLMTEAARMIMDDYPMVPLLQYTMPRLVKSYVGGYTLENALDRFRSKDLYIIKH
jgi:oligopeptide transport system substrate-binding protein